MLTKQDAKMAQGLAILAMLMLHLFCRIGELPYNTYLYVGDKPLLYYFGLFGDICVPIYCFCSGYAQMVLMKNEYNQYNKNSGKRAFKFLMHFWLVVIVFACVGLVCGLSGLDSSNTIPGDWKTFLGNLFLIGLSYNGAWWFVTTYLILLLAAPLMKKLVEKVSPIILIGISSMFYLVAYVFRFVYILELEQGLFNWAWSQLILFGTSQFSFIIGMVFQKYDIIGEIDKRLKNQVTRVILITILPIFVFVIHCIEESLVIAPFTAIVTLSCFHLWRKSERVKKVFSFLGKHSTNIWLIHMFFYMAPFKDLVFVVRFPLLILMFMLLLCIATSCAINAIENGLRSIWRRKQIR